MVRSWGLTTFLSLLSVAQSAVFRNSSTSAEDSTTSTITLESTVFVTQTVPPSPGPTGDPNDYDCCFVVLDHIDELIWNRWKTTTVYSAVNLTSFTTYMTPYPTTTITSVDKNVYTTNATFYWSSAWYRGIQLYEVANDVIRANETKTTINNMPNPTLGTTTLEKTITSTVVAGVTIQSPDAYYVYSKFRILTASAVLDDAGYVACATDSVNGEEFEIRTSYSLIPNATVLESTKTSTATLYKSLESGYITPTATVLVTSLVSRTYFTQSPSVITTDSRETFEAINHNLQNLLIKNATTTQEGVEITLPTPFLYYPERGNIPKINDSQIELGTNHYRCNPQGPPVINYGYPPQELLDHLYTNPAVLKAYPRITDCAPGGPSIKDITLTCVAPVIETAGGDLTDSTVIMVTPPAVPITQPPPVNPGPTTADPPAPNPTPNSPIEPAPTQPPPTPQPPQENPTQQPPTENPAPTNGQPTGQPPAEGTPNPPPGETQQPPASPPAGTDVANPTQPGTGANPTGPSNPANPNQPPPSNGQAPGTDGGQQPTNQIPTGGNAGAPSGPTAGQPVVVTTVVNGVPTTIVSQPAQVQTTVINGQPVTIPQPTSGQQLTTVINGQPTTLIAQPGVETTVINGVPTTIIVQPTFQPITTVINGAPTTIIPQLVPTPISTDEPKIADIIQSFLGITPIQHTSAVTVIGGTSQALVTGVVTIPLSEASGLVGQTTVEGGTTKVIVSFSTHVPISASSITLSLSSSSSSSSISISSSSSSSSSTSSSTQQSTASDTPTRALEAPAQTPSIAGPRVGLSWSIAVCAGFLSAVILL